MLTWDTWIGPILLPVNSTQIDSGRGNERNRSHSRDLPFTGNEGSEVSSSRAKAQIQTLQYPPEHLLFSSLINRTKIGRKTVLNDRGKNSQAVRSVEKKGPTEPCEKPERNGKQRKGDERTGNPSKPSLMKVLKTLLEKHETKEAMFHKLRKWSDQSAGSWRLASADFHSRVNRLGYNFDLHDVEAFFGDLDDIQKSSSVDLHKLIESVQLYSEDKLPQIENKELKEASVSKTLQLSMDERQSDIRLNKMKAFYAGFRDQIYNRCKGKNLKLDEFLKEIRSLGLINIGTVEEPSDAFISRYFKDQTFNEKLFFEEIEAHKPSRKLRVKLFLNQEALSVEKQKEIEESKPKLEPQNNLNRGPFMTLNKLEHIYPKITRFLIKHKPKLEDFQEAKINSEFLDEVRFKAILKEKGVSEFSYLLDIRNGKVCCKEVEEALSHTNINDAISRLQQRVTRYLPCETPSETTILVQGTNQPIVQQPNITNKGFRELQRVLRSRFQEKNQIFKHIDRDNDGFISAQDLTGCMELHQIPIAIGKAGDDKLVDMGKSKAWNYSNFASKFDMADDQIPACLPSGQYHRRLLEGNRALRTQTRETRQQCSDHRSITKALQNPGILVLTEASSTRNSSNPAYLRECTFDRVMAGREHSFEGIHGQHSLNSKVRFQLEDKKKQKNCAERQPSLLERQALACHDSMNDK